MTAENFAALSAERDRLQATVEELVTELSYVTNYFHGGIIPLDLHNWRERSISAIARATRAQP